MNAPHFSFDHLQPMATTQAAEGLPRRAFTVAEIDALTEAGFFHEDDRFELIGGEIVPMNAKGIFHEELKFWLNMYFGRICPAHLRFIPETTYRISERTFVEPDFLVFSAKRTLRGIKGPDALLVIEVSDTSLGYDLHRKPAIYAEHGVPELWVIDAQRQVIHVHRENTGTAYASVTQYTADQLVTPLLAPELAFRLADFDLEIE